MFDLFSYLTAERPRSLIPDWDYIRRYYNDTEIPKFMKYYRSTLYPVPSNHLLVKMVQLADLPFVLDYETYIERARYKARNVCAGTNVCHPVVNGKLFQPGVFYNSRCKEVIIGHGERFDVDKAVTDWESLEPIRVLRHDFSDLSLPRLNGDYPVYKDTFAVIAINIPMLLLQYRRYMEEMGIREDGEIDPISTFVGRYPITNALRSHLDWCVWNRWACFCRAEKTDRISKNVHPFVTLDFGPRMDGVWRKLGDTFFDRKPSFTDMLRIVPMVSKNTMYERVKLPDFVQTRYVNWGIGIALLPIIGYLVDLNHQFENPINEPYLNQIRRDLMRVTHDNVFRQYLPVAAYKAIEDYVDTMIKDKIGEQT